MSPVVFPPGNVLVGGITLTRGVANTSYLNRVSKFAGLVTITGRIDNGNGLTLSSSYQVVGTVPAWAIPSGIVLSAASMTGTTGEAILRVLPTGDVEAASSGSAVAFAFSYRP